MLRARYYVDGDILQANCPKSASPTWRAIIIGRNVLKEGLIRRIGNGRTTEVWHGRWLPGTVTMRLVCRLSDVPGSVCIRSNGWRRTVGHANDSENVYTSGCRSYHEYTASKEGDGGFLGLSMGEVGIVFSSIGLPCDDGETRD